MSIEKNGRRIMDIKTLTSDLIILLRNNMPAVTSPVGFNWNYKIFPDYPRNDISVESYPRISVTESSNLDSPVGIGDKYLSGKARNEATVFNIDIWTKKGSRDNAASITTADGSFTATSLRDYLGDKVYQIFLDKKQWLKTNKDIIDVEMLDDRTVPYMDQYEIFRRTVIVRISYTRIIN